jgi:hypothetical protein
VSSTTVIASLGNGRAQARVSSGSHPGGEDASCSKIASTVAPSAGTVLVVAGATTAVVGGADAVGAVVASGVDGVTNVDSDDDSDELHPATIAAMSTVPISERFGVIGRDRTGRLRRRAPGTRPATEVTDE